MESTDSEAQYYKRNDEKDENESIEESEITKFIPNTNKKTNNINDGHISKYTTSDPNDNVMEIREDSDNDESRHKRDHNKSHQKGNFISENYYKENSYNSAKGKYHNINYSKQYYEDFKNKFLGNKRKLDKESKNFYDSNTNNKEKTTNVRVIKYYDGEQSFDGTFSNPFPISPKVLIEDWEKNSVNSHGTMNKSLAAQLTREGNYEGKGYKLVRFEVPRPRSSSTREPQVIKLYYDSSNILDFATDRNLRNFGVENIIEGEKYQRLLKILPNDKKYMEKDYIPIKIYYGDKLEREFFYRPKFLKLENSKPKAQGPSIDDLKFFLGIGNEPKNSEYLNKNPDSKIGKALKEIANKADKDGKIVEEGYGNYDLKYINIYYKNKNENKEIPKSLELIPNSVEPSNISEKPNLNFPQIKKVPSEEKKQGFVKKEEYQEYKKNKDKNNNAKIINIFQDKDLKCTLYYIDPDEKHVFTKEFIESLLKGKSDKQVNDENNKKSGNDYKDFKSKLIKEAKKLKYEDGHLNFKVNLDEKEGDKVINIIYIPVNHKIKYKIIEEHQYKCTKNATDATERFGIDSINEIEFDATLQDRPKAKDINKESIKELIFNLCSENNIENDNLQDYEKELVKGFKNNNNNKWLSLKNIIKDEIECKITNENKSEPIKIEIKIKLPEISFKRNNPVYDKNWSSNGKEIYAKLNEKEFKEDISKMTTLDEKLLKASKYLDNLNDDMSEDSDFELECHCRPGNICKCLNECVDKLKCFCKDDRYYQNFVKISEAVKNGTLHLRYCRARLNGAAFLSRDRKNAFNNKDERKFRHFVFYDFGNFFKVVDETYTNSGEQLSGQMSLLNKAIEFGTPFGTCKIMPKHAATTTKGEDCFLESVLQSEVSSGLNYDKIDESFNKITNNYKKKKEIVEIMREFFKLKCTADQIETNISSYEKNKNELNKYHYTPADIWKKLKERDTEYYFRYKESKDPKDSYNKLVGRVKKLSLEKTQQQLVANICGVLMVSESIRLMDRGKTMTAMLNNLIRQNFDEGNDKKNMVVG